MGLGRFGLAWIGLDWLGHIWIGLDRFGLDLDCLDLSRIGLVQIAKWVVAYCNACLVASKSQTSLWPPREGSQGLRAGLLCSAQGLATWVTLAALCISVVLLGLARPGSARLRRGSSPVAQKLCRFCLSGASSVYVGCV